MNRAIRPLVLAALAVVVFARVNCGKPRQPNVAPILKLTITDEAGQYGRGITFDGDHYYTVTETAGRGVLCEYDKHGGFVCTRDVGLDCRAVFWHPREEELYVRAYGTSLHTADPEDEESCVELDGVFCESGSAVGFSPDGEEVYEFCDGAVVVCDLLSGEELECFELPTARENSSIAASDKYLFVWDDSDDAVAVYDLFGTYIARFDLPDSSPGGSLSWAKGLLWVAQSATGSKDASWHGYQLRGLP